MLAENVLKVEQDCARLREENAALRRMLGTEPQKEVLFDSKNSAEECFAVELQWFVNTGKELSQDSDGFYCAKLLGKNELVYDTKKHKWFKDSFAKKYFAPNRRIERGLKVFLFAIGVVALIWYIQRKRKI